MKKIVLFFFLIGICQMALSQDLEISNKWKLVNLVSRTMCTETNSKGEAIIKLVTVRKYQYNGNNKKNKDAAKTKQIVIVTVQEQRYYQDGECWSDITVSARPVDRENVSLAKTAGGLDAFEFNAASSNPSSEQSDNARIVSHLHVTNSDTLAWRSWVKHVSDSARSLDKDSSKLIDSIGLISFKDTLPAIRMEKDRKNWGFTVGFTPQIAFARIHVDEASFSDAPKLDKRVQQTRPIYGYSYSFTVNKWVDNSNRFYAGLSYEHTGWENKQSAVNWSSGYSYDTTTSSIYDFKFWQAGIGYAYMSKTEPVKFILDLGLSVLWKNHFDQNDTEISNQPGFKNTLLLGTIGAGINVTLGKRFSLEGLPTVSIPFTPVHTGYLRTSLYNVGFTGRLLFDLYKR